LPQTTQIRDPMRGPLEGVEGIGEVQVADDATKFFGCGVVRVRDRSSMPVVHAKALAIKRGSLVSTYRRCRLDAARARATIFFLYAAFAFFISSLQSSKWAAASGDIRNGTWSRKSVPIK